jgi:hypothetical protein
MSESAGRMWIAKYQGDNQAVERELARQEVRSAERPLTTADAITHNHHPESVDLKSSTGPDTDHRQCASVDVSQIHGDGESRPQVFNCWRTHHSPLHECAID